MHKVIITDTGCTERIFHYYLTILCSFSLENMKLQKKNHGWMCTQSPLSSFAHDQRGTFGTIGPQYKYLLMLVMLGIKHKHGPAWLLDKSLLTPLIDYL